MKTRNLIKSLGGTALVAAVLAFSTPANADPVTFLFNCTISGSGAATNVCDEGLDVAQLTIAETDVEGVLSLSILRLFPAPPDGPVNLTLNAIHLNYVGDLDDLPEKPDNPNQGSNYLEFSFNSGFSPLETIIVESNATTALNYKGFDLQLCDTGVGRCDTPVTIVDTIFGFVRSGSDDFNLYPELFDGLTQDTRPNGDTEDGYDRARMFDDCVIMPAHLRAAVHITQATSGSVENDEVCGGGGNYGPYYGSLAERPPQVPEPATLGLLGIGLFGMGLMRRRRKV